ncbi:hypothetical protein SAMD00019534_114440 [Acytostelium subglobosum LB1]|uniref:hypothetical protein n=1 Tax=Acytostelium subglobosum LB1 TaxID=1410327 RepID=UPI000644FF5E|nr:hypothetical protein SAMD00019534_114440 [Acytostelium subglobosum LB1]GAM28268.1 hypothetical protein SAMD00019534_114440 [Acytostelium subglobosum LB1]|eukprot:XP_012748902.1 hypothetical protein SAMD00019534_114440 [Acytostelium subglobosum LB1]
MIVFNVETKKQLQALMKEHLSRPEGIDDDPAAFEEWARKIVRVEFPSPLLEPGLALIDLPGFSISDNDSLFAIRKDFFEVFQPTGVVFCYANAFSDAVKDLIKSLPANLVSKPTYTKEFIFFANTKTSKGEVANNNGIDPNDEVPLELIHVHASDCFAKLKSSSLSSNESLCIDDRRFAIVNSMDFIRLSRSVENRHVEYSNCSSIVLSGGWADCTRSMVNWC